MAETAKGTVPGLERLQQLSAVVVKQKTGGFKGNHFQVLTTEGEVLFTLKEKGHGLTFLTDADTRGFHMNGVDNLGHEVFTLRRPLAFMSDKIEMSVRGSLFSVIRKQATFMTPMFLINDARDNPTLRVKGDWSDYDFQVQTSDKKVIGSISKKFRGVLKEMFSYKDNYIIEFPLDLEVRFKLAVVSTCVFIDYRYHDS